MLIFYLS